MSSLSFCWIFRIYHFHYCCCCLLWFEFFHVGFNRLTFLPSFVRQCNSSECNNWTRLSMRFWRYVNQMLNLMWKFSAIRFFSSPLMITTSPTWILDVLSLWCKLYFSLRATIHSWRNRFHAAFLDYIHLSVAFSRFPSHLLM